MRILLFLNFLLETLVGILFLAFPSVIPEFQNPDPTLLMMVRMYGFAALSLGVFSLITLLMLHDHTLLVVALAIFSFFHLGLFVIQLVSLINGGIGHPAGAIAHAVFAPSFFFFFLKER